METFKKGEKTFRVDKSWSVVQRRYSLSESKGYPWIKYSGSNVAQGDGIVSIADYSRADINERRFLYSNGPWWVDANHSHPGFGSLSIIFFAFVKAMAIKGEYCPIEPTLAYPDMRKMKISGKIRGYNVDLKGADLVFWFQCYSEKIGKYVNYACVGKPLSKELMDNKINDFELEIDIYDEKNWICLGSCDGKSDLYGYLELQDLDFDKAISMGFILVPLNVKPLWSDECDVMSPLEIANSNLSWPIDISSLPSGLIAIYDLDIEYCSRYRIVALN